MSGQAFLELTAAPATATTPILVLGLGNILFQDEGLGVRAVEYLQREYELPEHVQLMDGGTLGLDLLAYFVPGTRLLILDTIRSRQAPGSLIRLEGPQIPAALAQKVSMHQLGLQDLMAASLLRDTLPEKVVLWGMVPGLIDWGTTLSSSASAALPELAAAALGELQQWGVSWKKKE